MWRATTSPRRTLNDKYCSCVFKVTSKDEQTGYSGVPQAICSASLYNRRGLRGPGPVRCSYTRSYLESLTTPQLYWYSVAKGLIRRGDKVSRSEILDRLELYLLNK
jgi:hypothetical protein